MWNIYLMSSCALAKIWKHVCGQYGTPSAPNYNLFDFFDLKFDHLYYSKFV